MSYFARDTGLGRGVVVTEYLPRAWSARRADGTVVSRSADVEREYADGMKRFLSGARILARVDHDRIVDVHRVAEANGTAYLVAEHVRAARWRRSFEWQGRPPRTRCGAC